AEVPDGPAIILANEFLDALPVRQWVSLGNIWHERMVDHDGRSFIYAPGAALDPSQVPDFLESAPEGSVFEVSPAVEAVTGGIAARLCAQGGAALLIDYGHTERGHGETLQALKGHRFADPLAEPGEQDLTAHVDFAFVRDIAHAAGAATWGPITQGALLERLGIAARATRLLLNASKAQAEDIARARTRLVGADDMGRLFKALALTHPALPAPPGFEMTGED
ncbi:MAG: SAM-dependent methyltransferase, partial [Rhodospirillales bacterium]